MNNNNNNNDFFDVDYKEIKNEISLTAPQVAKKIHDTDVRVRYWADKFGDLIGIEEINGRKTYKESQIKKFAFIKDLIDNRNFTGGQIIEHISKHGFEYEKFDSELLNPKDPLGNKGLVSLITIENKELLKTELNDIYIKIIKNNQDTLDNMVQVVNNFMNIQKDMNLQNKAEIEASVDMIITNKSNQLKQDIQQEISSITDKLQEQSTQLQQKFQSIIDDSEKKATERDIKMTDNLNKIMEDRKRQYVEQNIKKHESLWNKIFKKKER